MEYIHFEAQECNEILMFKEKANFGYIDHPEKPALILQSGKRYNLFACVCIEYVFARILKWSVRSIRACLQEWMLKI